MKKQKTYDLKDILIGSKVIFDDGARGIVKESNGCKAATRFGKSIWLTHYLGGDIWNSWAYGYLDYSIVKVIKPKKRAIK